MHGLVFAELKRFATAKLDASAWQTLLGDAQLPGAMYLATSDYPDEQLVGIVTALSKRTGRDAQSLVFDFGCFIAPNLMAMFRTLIRREWRSLELIEQTEDTIHKVVRLRNPGAQPPKLVVRRDSADQVTLFYTSTRRLCALAKGIASGIGDHYNEKLTFADRRCMHRNDSLCEIEIRREPTQG